MHTQTHIYTYTRRYTYIYIYTSTTRDRSVLVVKGTRRVLRAFAPRAAWVLVTGTREFYRDIMAKW